jgi:mycobactin phenyloxazoline synthetase
VLWGADDIVEAVQDLLPGYMIPTRIEIVERMPLTDNGKLNRAAVLALLEPDASDAEDDAPSTPFEAALAAIVAEALGVARVGVHDDFFGSGGDSVLATTAVARVREWLDVDHALVADLLVGRTVAGLAGRLLDREIRRGTPDRLDGIAQLYLDVASMSDEEILAQA